MMPAARIAELRRVIDRPCPPRTAYAAVLSRGRYIRECLDEIEQSRANEYDALYERAVIELAKGPKVPSEEMRKLVAVIFETDPETVLADVIRVSHQIAGESMRAP